VNIRIEGSLNKKGQWDIYKVYYDGKGLNYVEEYSAEDRDKALYLINKLKDKKQLTIKEIKQIKSLENKSLFLEFKRIYKEEYIEKWDFSLDKSIKNNFVLVKFDEKIRLDIVVHEKYKILENHIIQKIVEILGLKELVCEIIWNIYYFTYNQSDKIKNSQNKGIEGNIIFGKIGFGFSNKD
jgi:hypothetical protein